MYFEQLHSIKEIIAELEELRNNPCQVLIKDRIKQLELRLQLEK